MKKYYLHNGAEQQGPFSLNELKSKNISKNTPVWFEGLADWTEASNIEELNGYFKTTPPPFEQKNTNPPPIYKEHKHPIESVDYNATTKKKSPLKTIAVIIILLVIGSIGFNLYKDKIGTNLKVTVNPPNPRVLNSRTAIDPNATLLDYKQAVYATIYNDGGSGRILVKATIDQGKHHFEETKEIFLAENSSEEVYLMFDGPRALGGSIDFDVFVKSIE